MLEACEQAAELLAHEGLDATVWDPRAVSPLCDKMLADAARHETVVTVEDGLRAGGAGSAIRDALMESTDDHDQPAARVLVLGVPLDYLPHGKADAILADLGLDATGIAATVKSELL